MEYRSLTPLSFMYNTCTSVFVYCEVILNNSTLGKVNSVNGCLFIVNIIQNLATLTENTQILFEQIFFLYCGRFFLFFFSV